MALPQMKFCFALALLGIFPACSAIARQAPNAAPPPPDAAAQQQLLEAMGNYARQYVSNLPNFVCLQVTREFEAGKTPKHWRQRDAVTSRLVFDNGKEERTPQLVNDKPVASGLVRPRSRLTTVGEFGILVGNVFGSASDSSFTWKGWEVLRGKRLAVFDYSIDLAHSTVKLSLSDLAQALVAYHGSIYADPETGGIWRITEIAVDIPPDVKTKSFSKIIDYGEVPIGGTPYLLPLQASVWMTTDSNNVRNDIEFADYRKFEADSKITFGADDTQKGAQPVNPAPPPP